MQRRYIRIWRAGDIIDIQDLVCLLENAGSPQLAAFFYGTGPLPEGVAAFEVGRRNPLRICNSQNLGAQFRHRRQRRRQGVGG